MSGCMEVKLGEEDNSNPALNSPNEKEVEQGMSDPTLIAGAFDDSAGLDLNAYTLFSVRNDSDKDLRSIFIDLSSGENSKIFASIDANYASTETLALMMPSNIVDNKFCYPCRPKGKIREIHYVPNQSCVDSGGLDCNKLIIGIDENKYQELK